MKYRLAWLLGLLINLMFLLTETNVYAGGGFVLPSSVLSTTHAHNDYLNERPLLDALGYGFRSIEVDVHLIGDELYVAHLVFGIRPQRTLQSLYLEPLREVIRKNEGLIYGDSTQLMLLIDIKTQAAATYRRLRCVLEAYKDIIQVIHPDSQVFRPVSVVISGNRPRAIMENETVRYAGFDGRMDDLYSTCSPLFMPIISEKWNRCFQWRGRGSMPAEEKLRLKRMVERAHRAGRWIRFWGTPDMPNEERHAIWTQLLEAGVDLINTDDLRGLRTFLRSYHSDENLAGL